jgi:hypothetical protein
MKTGKKMDAVDTLITAIFNLSNVQEVAEIKGIYENGDLCTMQVACENGTYNLRSGKAYTYVQDGYTRYCAINDGNSCPLTLEMVKNNLGLKTFENPKEEPTILQEKSKVYSDGKKWYYRHGKDNIEIDENTARRLKRVATKAENLKG